MKSLFIIGGFLALSVSTCNYQNQMYRRENTGLLLAPLAPQKEHRKALAYTIAFGSSDNQGSAQPILSLAARHKPGLFIFLGDTIYGDTYDMDALRACYARLAVRPEFQELLDSVQTVATWDGYNYGGSNAGRAYPFKEESKEIFLDFWQVPPQDARRQREGIYTSYFYEGNWKVLQVILLDTHTFRDGLRPYEGQEVKHVRFPYPLNYWPHETKDSTLLGEAQWEWLEEQLSMPADIRIIASSTQFGISYNGYEAWANFPHERERMVELIKKTKASGVVFISGGAHHAELSALRRKDCYTLYDFTSGGIAPARGFSTPNLNRIEGPVRENNFGLIEISWGKKWAELTFKAIDVDGALRFERKILLDELQFWPEG